MRNIHLLCIFRCRATVCCRCLASRSNNFIIGLTNTTLVSVPPTLGSYAVCRQYPGSVGSGATVNLKCACGMAAHKYVIVQFPRSDYANFCELKVYIRRKFL